MRHALRWCATLLALVAAEPPCYATREARVAPVRGAWVARVERLLSLSSEGNLSVVSFLQNATFIVPSDLLLIFTPDDRLPFSRRLSNNLETLLALRPFSPGSRLNLSTSSTTCIGITTFSLAK